MLSLWPLHCDALHFLSLSAEHKHLIERRVKIITEEIVDGVVVASCVDTKVEMIQ